MSPSEIDENTDKLDDIANSLADDSDDFDFSEFEDADDSSLEDSSSSSGTSDSTGEDAANGTEAETGEQNQPQSQFQPMEDNAQSDEDKSYMDMLPKQTNEAPKPNPEETRRPDPAQAVPPRMPQGPANYNPYENYQPPRMQPPVYDPAFDRQMQAAAMNNAVNAIEAAFMAQKMAQQLSDQQKQFEEAFTLKNEKFVQETVEKAVNEKFQKTLDEQMEKIMSAEDDDVFTSVDEYIPEEKSLESDISVEESPVAEADSDESGSPAEVSLSEDPFAVVDDFATDEEPVVEETPAEEESPSAPAASSSEYKQIIKKIEEKLSDPEAAKTNAEQIELFKSLKVLASCMPDNQKDSYISCKIRMVLEYLIAKLSGRPGLLITAEALLESGVLGQEYSSKLEETSDEDLSNDLIKHVITYMKKLAGQLEDSALSSALCTSADSILEKIELENSKSQIF